MLSTRLLDLPRTTGFRVALLFMGLFTVLAVMLFGLVYWQTSAYLTSRVDDFLHREAAPLYALPTAAVKTPNGRDCSLSAVACSCRRSIRTADGKA